MIQPRVLKGFRDSLPSQEIVKKQVMATLEEVFSSYGFVPIDTPVLEYTEVLLGKGGGETDKQIFHFVDNGGRDVALRFDLTVPFARFMAVNLHKLPLPFKRYHIDKVWRGENPQKGRYREFYQCDFDIVGIDSAVADTEILVMMSDAFKAIGLSRFTIHLAHRGLLNAFLHHINCGDHAVEILRIVDKLRKIGKQAVKNQLLEIVGSEESTDAILDYITPKEGESTTQTITRLSALAGNEEEHTNRLKEIFALLNSLGIATNFILDPSITRGLDYYTGVVFETFLTDLPSIGSVCSGGRYNDLASLYTKEELPGVGSSIGLDRLLSALDELDASLAHSASASDILIVYLDEALLPLYFKTAQTLRERGVRCDLYLSDKKLMAQYKYGEAHEIPYALFIKGEDDFTLRNLEQRSDQELTLEEIVAQVKGTL